MRAGMRFLIGFAALVVLAMGGLAACATRDIPFETLEPRYGFPDSQRYEPEPGLSVHYLDEGPRDRPTLVMVHGFAASVHAWTPWVERLSGDYRLIRLDLPGHGLTRTPKGYRASLDGNVALVDSLTRSLGVEHFVLIGNSMGGAVAWNYALAHPERLDGLVLVDSAGWPGEGARRRQGPPLAFALLANPIGRAILKTINPKSVARGGLESAYLDKSMVTDELVSRYADLALAPGHRDVLITMNSRPARTVSAEDFASIRTPTLVMAGEQDKIIPADQSKAIAKAMPGARLVLYPDGGHVPMEQLPDRSAADLRAFLESLAPTPLAAAPASTEQVR